MQVKFVTCQDCDHRKQPMTRDEVLMAGHGYVACVIMRPWEYTAVNAGHACPGHRRVIVHSNSEEVVP